MSKMLGINMKFIVFVVWVAASTVSSITVSSNGNSPETKMLGGMMVDVQKGFVPMTTTTPPSPTPPAVKTRTEHGRSKKTPYNATKLSINERYRRLIPYMTFYYANDLTPTKEPFTAKDVEVQKAEIVETPMEHQTKKLLHSPYRNVPRYQGNRPIQYNTAPFNDNKVYQEAPPIFQEPVRVTHNYNPLIYDPNLEGQHFRKVVYKPNNIKSPSVPFSLPTRKPHVDLFHGDDHSNVRYYFADKEPATKYKLVPYEQSPPVKSVNHHDNFYAPPKKAIPVPVLVNKEPVYIKHRPAARPQYTYENGFIQRPVVRKLPSTVTENYYEKFRPPQPQDLHSAIENGFKPIIVSTETSVTPSPIPQYENDDQSMTLETATSPGIAASPTPDYYQYVVEEPTFAPPPVQSNTMSLGDLLDSLQLNKSIPKPITKDNVGSSIRTLLQVLNALKAVPQDNEVAVSSTQKPFTVPQAIVEDEPKTVSVSTESSAPEPVEFQEEHYLAPVNPPSQHLDDYSPGTVTSQSFPLRVQSDDDGGTPGRPGVDYPVLTVIPPTRFNCKTQRYKGFFADPETRCQVWHYCDLNGGQASFLCPNGTIFSQAALTCDWWFNVRCATTTQLYVLNESLYKYILPHSPKFPEDYSGPLVDKYLTLKFKEMEDQFRKNKNKQSAAEKVDSSEEEDSDDAAESTTLDEKSDPDVTTVSEASVIVESPGTSGNVERLQD